MPMTSWINMWKKAFMGVESESMQIVHGKESFPSLMTESVGVHLGI